MSFSELPAGWEVWSEAEDRAVLAYRPDVFDGDQFPAPCMPTIYLTKGQRGRRPGPHRAAPDDPWYVTLILEPDVTADPETYETRAAAVEGACSLATRFEDGDVDYRDLYQVPREDYFAKLNELTGPD